MERYNEFAIQFLDGTFASNDQQPKFDLIQLRSWPVRRSNEISTQLLQLDEPVTLTGDWTCGLVKLCEQRQAGLPIDGRYAGDDLHSAILAVEENIASIQGKKSGRKNGKFAAYRAAKQLEDLRNSTLEWYHCESSSKTKISLDDLNHILCPCGLRCGG